MVSASSKPQARQQNWLDRSIILVKLDPRRPTACYLAKVHGTAGRHGEEARATITSDGSAILWATTWGEDAGQGKVFLMRLLMPSGWQGLLR